MRSALEKLSARHLMQFVPLVAAWMHFGVPLAISLRVRLCHCTMDAFSPFCVVQMHSPSVARVGCGQAPLFLGLCAGPSMDISRRQGKRAILDVGSHDSSMPITKRQAAASVTDFVYRRAKAFRGDRPPLTSSGARPPPRPPATAGAAVGGRSFRQCDVIDEPSGASGTFGDELPPPTVQLPLGTFFHGVTGMTSFMASGGREGGRAAAAAGRRHVRASTDRRVGYATAKDAPRPLVASSRDETVPEVTGSARAHRVWEAGRRRVEGGGQASLDASLAATLFPPATPARLSAAVTAEGNVGRMAGHAHAFDGR